MKDVLDSASNTDDEDKNDTYQGLSGASINIGEGAALYLQTMQTFAMLFFILTIINLPIYYLLSNSTENNNINVKEFGNSLKLFTYGNINRK